MDGPHQILQRSLIDCINSRCIQYGSTYQGRRTAAKVLLQRTQQVPIYVHVNEVLVPTSAPRNQDVVFLNAIQVAFLTQQSSHTMVTFRDGSTVAVAISTGHLRTLLGFAEQLSQMLQLEIGQKESVYTK